MPKIDAEVTESLDILIGCLREIQRQLWQMPLGMHQEGIKTMPELEVMERTIAAMRHGNYQEARENRSEAEQKYLK